MPLNVTKTRYCYSRKTAYGKQRRYSIGAQVLVYDHLLGNGLKCGGKYRAAVTRHKASLAAALVRIKTRRGAATNTDLLPPSVRLAGAWILVIVRVLFK
jgi:hypothetical protein